MKQGDLLVTETVFMPEEGRRAERAGVRAPRVARKGRNGPRAKSRKKFKDTIRAKTPRTSGQSLTAIIRNLNRTLQGWFGYFQHSHRIVFPGLDGWVRMRLRSILRRRRGGKGGGRGVDHQCWPNAFFAELGLFSLVTAHACACRSSSR